ncbi:MAG: glycosyltransferase family 4 protein [Methylococcaceae bacterium]|jgi:glycosyltransferase involved in cell wall biosynthesis
MEIITTGLFEMRTVKSKQIVANCASPQRPLRVMMMGLRGVPNVQGGVETHVEHLSPNIARLGCDLTVLVRSPYYRKELGYHWNGIKLVSIWSPKTKAVEALVHSFLCVLYAAIKRPDILHIHAIGPGIVTLLARILGLKVVVTHHGPDYDRQKWGKFAKLVLKIGELISMRFANERIVISQVIADLVKSKYGVASSLIPNGVVLPELCDATDILDKYALTPKKYIILVSRLVPEKRHLDLINAFALAKLDGWKLVLVGGSDHPDKYMQNVLEQANATPNVVLTGFLSGKALQELSTHAGVFVLPSSHEGLPIALLEALSFGLPVITSDIPANLEINLPPEFYFQVGNVIALSEKLIEFSKLDWREENRNEFRALVKNKYNWEDIADKTFNIYKKCSGYLDKAVAGS